MAYKLENWVKQALRKLPIMERLSVRWQIHKHLSRASRADNELCRLANSADCGFEMLDHITGGRASRLERERDANLEKLRPIMENLKQQRETP